MEGKSELEIYKARDSQIEVRVQFEKDTVWLSQKQMSDLFDKDTDTIGLHLKNIFAEEEIEESSTTEFFSVVQKEGKRQVTRKIKYYNLDAILSVGYRVNSKRGTQFRQWATQRLKDYLVKGYALNEKRLKEQTQKQLQQLQRTVKMIQGVSESKQLTADEATGLLQVIADYTLALDVLDKYDHQQLKIAGTEKKQKYRLTYAGALNAIDVLRRKFKSSSLFGKEKDASFQSSVNAIYQTFSKKELYPSVEEKAANLLYFVVKNHSFVDGNKRIAAFLFVWFLEKNLLLYRSDGAKRIADNALVALTLLIAESKPEEKEIMVKVIVNLINSKN